MLKTLNISESVIEVFLRNNQTNNRVNTTELFNCKKEREVQGKTVIE